MKVGDIVHYVDEIGKHPKDILAPGKVRDGAKDMVGNCVPVTVIAFPEPPEVLPGAIRVRRVGANVEYCPTHGFESNQYHSAEECKK